MKEKAKCRKGNLMLTTHKAAVTKNPENKMNFSIRK
jgi:hypothetical protein